MSHPPAADGPRRAPGAGWGRPILPGRLRVPALVLMGLAALTFLVLTAVYAGHSQAGRLDDALDLLVADPLTTYGQVLRAIQRFGSPMAVIIGASGLAALALLLRRYRLALLALLGPAVTGLATTALKPVIGRRIEGDFAFPSGHTAGLTAISLVAALLVISFARSRLPLVAVLAGLAVLAVGVTIGLALLASGSHYPTDTVGGFCVAMLLVIGSALLIDTGADRLRAGGRPPGRRASAGP